jgi:hypothetical protein
MRQRVVRIAVRDAMPILTACPKLGCPNLVGHGRPCLAYPRPSRWAGRQARGGTRAERGYSSAWDRMRKQVGE